jgi:hypothetical protein
MTNSRGYPTEALCGAKCIRSAHTPIKDVCEVMKTVPEQGEVYGYEERQAACALWKSNTALTTKANVVVVGDTSHMTL